MTMTSTQSTIITPLRYQRLLRGWSQAELATRIYALCIRDGHPRVAITKQSIHQWEHGKHLPMPRYRKQLCEIFDMNALQLGFLNNLLSDRPIQDNNATNKHRIQQLVQGHAPDPR